MDKADVLFEKSDLGQRIDVKTPQLDMIHAVFPERVE